VVPALSYLQYVITLRANGRDRHARLLKRFPLCLHWECNNDISHIDGHVALPIRTKILENGTFPCPLYSWYSQCIFTAPKSLVAIATDCELDYRGVAVRVPGYGQKFSLLRVIQTGSGAHPVFYQMNLFPGGKVAGAEADHSPLTSAEVKKMRIYTSTPLYVFMAYCLITRSYAQIRVLSSECEAV
jgi:hypothetical protein